MALVPPPPTIASVAFDTIQSVRRKYVYMSPCKPTNAPVLRIRRKKWASIQPENCVEDPYIATILIALAQEKQRRQQQQQQQQKWPEEQSKKKTPVDQLNRSSPASSKVYVLAIPRVAPKYLYIYTACIPPEFLDRCDRPSHSFSCYRTRLQ
ncbi:hypothetical protein BJX76DRAFT_360032 [Aspergillus varians]